MKKLDAAIDFSEHGIDDSFKTDDAIIDACIAANIGGRFSDNESLSQLKPSLAYDLIEKLHDEYFDDGSAHSLYYVDRDQPSQRPSGIQCALIARLLLGAGYRVRYTTLVDLTLIAEARFNSIKFKQQPSEPYDVLLDHDILIIDYLAAYSEIASLDPTSLAIAMDTVMNYIADGGLVITYVAHTDNALDANVGDARPSGKYLNTFASFFEKVEVA